MKSLLIAFLMMLFCSVQFTVAADDPGKTAFLANKCNTCHSMSSEGIEKTLKTKQKKESPDLSTIGDKRTADWIVKYLKKTETIDNAKHTKNWTGKDEELMAIAKWLEAHKKPAQ